jgi:hypothetical protein
MDSVSLTASVVRALARSMRHETKMSAIRPPFASSRHFSRPLTVALAVWAFCACYSFICRAAAEEQAAPGAAMSVWNGVYTDEQAKRGEGLYLRECASCHLEDLMGVEYSPPLTIDFFISDWGLGALTVGDLFERIRTSMPKDKPGSLSRQGYADILAHILKLNNFPAGRKELDHDAIVLKQIRMNAKPQQ